MRIADKMNFDQVKNNLAKNRSDMAELQNQAATQKKVNKPSDDPVAAVKVLGARTEISGGAQYLRSINAARAFLELTDQSLGELTEVLMRAKELAISQANDASANERSREVTATEVEQLHSQAAQVANRKLGDRFIFGGFHTTQAPFDLDGGYRGDDGEIKIMIDKEATVAMNVPGSRVFLGKQIKAPADAGPHLRLDSEGSEEPRSPISKPAETTREKNWDAAMTRGPASTANNLDNQNENQINDAESTPVANNLSDTWKSGGVNVFHLLKDLEIALRTNDKGGIQESIDTLDEAMAQVVLARSVVGARVMTLASSTDSLQKSQVDTKTLASSLEDADTFELVSDLNKTENTLKASLATSSKLIQPSLLDFLR